MKTLIMFFVAVAVCGPLTACSRQGPTVGYSEDDGRTFVQPGTPRQAILDRFGKPTSQDKDSRSEDGRTEVYESFYYIFPPPRSPGNQKWEIGGFVVDLKSGKAVSCHPIHR